MDEEILEMIEDLIDELINLEEQYGFDKDEMRKLLHNRITWVINYVYQEG